MSDSFLDALASRVLLGDGAMGTQLQAAGLEPGGCGEAWNLDAPERILAIQRRYVEAGSDCLITNTFGASRIMLARHDRGNDAAALNEAGARIAREAIGDRQGFVLGDIGPFGGLMEPYGEVEPERVREAFLEQARALVAGGVDAIIIETQTALEEIGIALEVARLAGAPCVIASFAFDVTHDRSEIRTMMGIDPEDAAAYAIEHGADVLALNCGSGVDMLWATRAVERYRKVSGLPTMAQPNAGLPVLEDLQVVYKQRPEEMAADLPGLLRAGARVVGGCCGSTPEHIRLFREIVDQWNESENA